MNILIVSNNPTSKVLNNGKTFESLFSCFKRDELFQLFFRPNGCSFDDFDYCESYYSITDMDVIRAILLRRRRVGGVVDDEYNKYDRDNYISKQPRISKFVKRLSPIRDLFWSTNVWKTKELDSWLRTISPDCVFLACGNCSFSHSIARYVCAFLDVPLCSYFGDDYLLYPQYTSLIDKLQHYRTKKFYQKTIEASAICFGIGDAICKEYSEYYHKPFNILRTPVEIKDYVEEIHHSSLIVSYFGGLHLNRWKMICRLSKVLRNDSEFRVYTMSPISDEIKSAFQESNIQVYKGITGMDLSEAMNEANVLLHVESDDIEYRSITRLSISTKIPEYLCTGRLVLGFGPIEVASMKLISDNNLGIIISSESSNQEIEDSISLIYDQKVRKIMGNNARSYVMGKFNFETIVTTFKKQLSSIIR